MDIKISMEYISSRFENEPNEIWNHMSEKGSKGRFFALGKFANPTNEGREGGGRKEEHFTFLGNCPPTPPLSRKGGEEKLPTYPSPKPERRRKETAHLPLPLTRKKEKRNCPPTPPLNKKGGEENVPTYPSPKPERRRRETAHLPLP